MDSLNPIHFFEVQAAIPYAQEHADLLELPHTSPIFSEDPIASLYMGWNERALLFTVHLLKPSRHTHHPHIRDGDAVELFIDTRNNKSAGFPTRFCHHFFFLPQPHNDLDRGEITHFRTDDSHPHCDPSHLLLESKRNTLNITIPASCLHGYNPEATPLGFSYRISAGQRHAQHFSLTPDTFSIDQQPSLWGTVERDQG